MAKNSVYDWDTTPANNTDVGGVGITGNSLPSNLDDGMRTLMAQIKSWSTSLGLSSGDQVAKLGSANVFTTVQSVATSAAGAKLTLERTGNSVNATMEFKTTGGSVYIGQGTSNVFAVGATNNLTTGTWMTLTSAGAMDLPSGGSFAINGGAATGVNGVTITEGGMSRSRNGTTTQGQITFLNANGQVGQISTNGSSTTYQTTSDETFKDFDGFLSAERAIEVILADPVRTWHWIPEKGGGPGMGWGAQTSYAISPDLAVDGGWVDFDGNPTDPDAEGAMYVPWGIDFGKRTPYLWAAVTELLARDEAKTQTIADLQTRLAALEAGA